MVATQLTVSISGGGPYGLRLNDGSDQSVVIVKVRKNSRGDEAGLREGDTVLTVNGRSCKGAGASAVSQWIDNSGQKVTIQVMRNASDSVSTTPAQDESLETVTVSRARPDQLEHRDQPVPTRTILRQEPGLDFTIKAPSGVDVQQNADKSFTVTIGMPVQLDLEKRSQETEDKNHEQFCSKHDTVVDSHSKQEAQLQQPEEEETVARPFQGKQLERILSEGSGSEPNTPDDLPRPGKKLFVDSAFYDDPEHKYPTAEEQIQLARQVAMSVISPANLKSKGHRMFMKRKERAIRWTTGLSDEEKAQLSAQMAAAKAAEAAGEPLNESASYGAEQPQSAPSAMPTSVMFAPKLPKEKDVERLNAMSNEELERMMLQERKTTHTGVSPQMCFSLVDDLKSMKGKGGKLFAKRQARAEKWGAEKSEGKEGSVEEEEDEEPGSVEPNPQLVEKLKAEHRARANADRGQKSSSGVAPVNRLKEMIDAPKAAMTPWDAVAQYGSVEKAFEHLENVPGKQKPGQQNLVDTLQQQQKRRREGGGGAGAGRGGAVRPKSTIGGIGMERTGQEEALGAEGQRSKIETLGGNPNAGDLASAMKASLASARSSRGAGPRSGRLNAGSKPGDTGAAKDHSTTNRNPTIGTLNA